jgi:voltage-gated potassium channel Kch
VSRQPNPFERQLTRLLRDPPSVRTAAAAIVMATALVVIGGGVLIRLVDHEEYSNIWVGMWWSLQTVTTVGYGDVTPKRFEGRLVGVLVMLQGIAFIAIVTAAITSTFVARATRDIRMSEAIQEEDEFHRIEARLDDLDRKLDAVLRASGG